MPKTIIKNHYFKDTGIRPLPIEHGIVKNYSFIGCSFHPVCDRDQWLNKENSNNN